MLYANKYVDDLENLNELVSLENKVQAVKLEDKVGKQSFHEEMKNLFEPVTKTIKDVSEDVTKTMMTTSKENNLALQNLNHKLLETMNDRGLLASYLMSPLSKIIGPEISKQYKLVKDSSSARVNDLLIHNTIPIILQDNLLTFRHTGKIFELKGDLLKTITNKNYNVDHASLSDKKLMYEFAKEMKFDSKGQSNKSTRDRTLKKILKSPVIMTSGISTVFLSYDSNEIFDRIKLFLQVKHAGNSFDIINQEIVATVDKLLENKCISKKQHKQLLIKCNLLHE